jgi:hypothetical protein
MTQPEIDALARELGITQEAWPEFWQPVYDLVDDPRTPTKMRAVPSGKRCTLPAPDSDDPRAVLWEPFLMRAFKYWPDIMQGDFFGGIGEPNLHREYKVRDQFGDWCLTPTAALYSAYKAQRGAR